MNFSIALEQVQGNGFRATALVPTPIIAEAATRDEAVDKIRAMIDEKLSTTEFIQIDVPVSSDSNSWLAIAGSWCNHPDIEEVEEHINTYRQQVNANPDRL